MSSTTTQQPPKKSWLDSAKSFFDHRSIIMLYLGFSAGFPPALIFATLSLWLNEAGFEKKTITLFALASLSYAFKFIWAPLIDAIPVPAISKWLGRRRSWLLLAQFGVVGAILLMASVNPFNNQTLVAFSLAGYDIKLSALSLMATGSILLGFFSATQDILIDAFRVEIAPPSFQPTLSAIYIAGYRIGMVVSGAGALYLADYFGTSLEVYNYEAWRNTYWIMASVMSIAILTTLTAYEPNVEIKQQNKVNFNLKVMGIYSAFLLIPGFVYLIWFLLDKFFTDILGNTILLIPDYVTNFAFKYSMGLSFFLPIAILLLLVNQPKFVSNTTKLVDNNFDYVRLVAVFFLSLFGFILVYRFVDMPKSESLWVDFIYKSSEFFLAVIVASFIGYLLVTIGLVKKEIALKTWINPIVDFFKRYGKNAVLLLALIGLYRISDIVAGKISYVFYQDMGFTKTDIGNAVKFVGVIMGIIGGFLGGLMSNKIKIMHAMMMGAVLASVTNLIFILLTYHEGSFLYMYLAVVLDNLAAGLASAVFVAFLSALTSIKFTAVQYAIFSSLMFLFPSLLGGYSGTIVDGVGYAQFFVISFVIGIPVLILIYLVDKKLQIGENDTTGEMPKTE